MYTLSGLPGRGPTDPKLSRGVYLMALRGVTRHSLERATLNFIQGHSEVDHGFMPSPPELRKECERIMKPIADVQHLERVKEQTTAEIIEFKRKNAPVRDHRKNREVIEVGVDHLTWLAKVKRRQYPDGALWDARAAIVYGPVLPATLNGGQ